jgi:hypothetical protein
MAEDLVPFPNADKVGDFIESEKDPVVRSLLRLVYGNFLRSSLRGERPAGAVDLLHCFKILRASGQNRQQTSEVLKTSEVWASPREFCPPALSISFHQKEALANAVRGNFGDPEAGSNGE